MFHLYITLAYIIPNIYVYFRIKNLFISKEYRLLYVIIYLILVCIYPFSEQFSHQEKGIFIQVLSNFAGYLLPFYLYLFLLVLVFDLFLLLNLLIPVLSIETRETQLFKLYSFSILIVVPVIIVVIGSLNLNTILTSKYRIEIPRKQSQIDHLKIAFVADFHIQQNLSLEYVEQYVKKMSALAPDIIFYGGDIVEGDRENETTEAVELALKNLHSKYQAYGVLGNHEFYGGQEQGLFFRKAGIKLICDTILRIYNSYYLGGRYDRHFRDRKTINEISETASSDLPLILLDHRPDELQEVSKTSVDIQFSGHTHHGQMFPVNLITNSVYELSWGYKKIRNTHFFVTSGLRLWGPPVKTAGKSEIMLVDIYFK